MTTTDPTTTDPTDGRTSKNQRSLVELADGRTFVVRITMPDRTRWDFTAPRKQWGKAQDVPFLADSFVTWSAAKRQGDYTDSWDAWSGRPDAPGDLIEITHLDDDDTGDDAAFPTRTAPSPEHS
jgi:hypothetical protein